MKSLIDRHFWVFLLCLASFAVFIELGRMDVYYDNEGQRATPPAEMLRSGDFVVPTINGETYLAKPPLLYWAIAGVYSITGDVSAFAARIPTATCAVALIMAIYFAFRKRLGEHPARWAAVALLASPYFLGRARWAGLDIPLTLATFLAMMGCWTAFDARRPVGKLALTVGAGIATGAAILLKGPSPFLFLGAVWVGYLLTRDELDARKLKALAILTVSAMLIESLLKLADIVAFPFALVSAAAYCLIWAWSSAREVRGTATLVVLGALTLGTALAAPWAVAVLQAQGWDSIRELLHSEVITRTHTATDINRGSPFFYILALPVILAPWGFLLPFHTSSREWNRNDQNYRFCMVSAWVSILIFSLIAGKEHEYIMPAHPFLLVLLGVHLTRVIEGQAPAWMATWTRYWGTAMLGLMMVLACAGVVYAGAAIRHPVFIAETVALALLILAAGGWALRNTPMRLHALALQILLVLVMGLLVTRSFHYVGKNSLRELAETAGDLTRSGYQVEAGWFRNPFTPPFAFYAEVPIPMQINSEIVQEKLEGDAPYYYLVRQRELENGLFLLNLHTYKILMGPYTSKGYLLIGNAPLPSSTAAQNGGSPKASQS